MSNRFAAAAARCRRSAALEPLEARVLLSSVVGRFVFYNHSAFDGNDATADARDVAAIAPDKTALLPGGTAGFANYTSYTRGLNGVAVDLAGDGAAPGELGAGDFEFRVGTSDDPTTWQPAPVAQVTRLAPAGGSNTARYLISFSDNSIHNEWLQVTVRANAASGLARQDVFYFGNVPGETGDRLGSAAVSALDVARVRARSGAEPAGADDPCDFNRDGRVNALDVAVARAANSKPALHLISPPALDTQSPTVSVTAPADHDSVSGTISVAADAADDVAVAGVQFQLDGVPLGAEDTAAPYSVTWDTTSAGDGPHQLTAVARDAAGNAKTSAIVHVTVANADVTAPTVAVTAPAADSTVVGPATLTASASDNVGVVAVQFLVDGVPVGAEDAAAPYSVVWDSKSVADGPHAITARARDAAGNVSISAARTVNVLNLPTGPAAVGQWGAVQDWPLVAINQVLLKDGRVLMWDGDGSGGPCIGSTSARVYDPATGQFTPVPLPYFTEHEDDIFCSGQTLLADGRVLVVGGHDCDGPGVGIVMSNLFDPVTMTWTRGPDMHFPRWYPTATTLSDGRVIVLGGTIMTNDDYVTTPEIYDPVSNTFTTLPNADLAVPSYSWVYQAPDGRVVVTGSNELKDATYALDINTQTWSVLDPAILDHGSGVMYLPGQYMKAGSSYVAAPQDNGGAVRSLATTYVLDTTQRGAADWQQTASMAYPRTHLNLTILPDGNVVATGGSSDIGGLTASKAVYPAELWSPVTKTWTTLASMQTPRMYHSTALLLPDGRVLVAGGGRLDVAENFLSGEFYSPAYLFKGARPTITSAPSTLAYNAGFFVGTPDGAGIASVALVRNGAVTHSDNMNQRYLPLSFQQTAGGLTVRAPADANTAPPGDYMLFIVNSNGVPCVAPFVRFAAPYEDSVPPTAPANLAASGGLAAASLSWSAATDNNVVKTYNVYRSATSGFTPAAQNLVGSSATTTFTDTGVPAGTFYYVVRAVDAAGNIGPASNEASAVVTADTVPPTVSLTSPAAGATLSGVVTISADASDNASVTGVRFLVDGVAVGPEDVSAPYSIGWVSASVANGPHTVTAVARDMSGNETTSAPLAVTVHNTAIAGLVAAWGFDEGSGTTAQDVSGHGHAGELANAEWTAAGKYGSALSFNGVDSWVTVADAADLELAGGMTLEAWVKPAEINGFETVVLKERGPDHLSYALYAHDPDRSPVAPGGYVNTTSGADTGAGGTSQLALGVWAHLATTYDGAVMRMYVNGVLVGSKAVSGDINETDDVLRIGGNGVWGEFFSGTIDEVRIYNRALSADEIAIDRATPVGAGAATQGGGGTSTQAAAALSFPPGTFADAGRDRTTRRSAWENLIA